jgi:uncharacterized lipoprotein YmbA
MRGLRILGLLLLAGCVSPNPVLYTLAVVPGPVRAGAPHAIQVRRIGLAGYLDRPGIVRSTADYKLYIATDDRWGEPFGGLLVRVLDQDLSQRLPGSAIFADSGAISADPDLIVEIDVQRFDADSTGVVVLSAQVAVRPGDRGDRAQTRPIRLQVTPSSTSTADYVAALSQALGQMADIIASMAIQK